MRPPRKHLLAILPVLTAVLCADAFPIDGYFKSFFVAFDQPRYENGPARPVIGSVNNRLRLKDERPIGRGLKLNLAYDLSPRIQDPSLFSQTAAVADIKPLEYRVADLNSPVYPSGRDTVGSFGLYQNLDRLFLSISTGPADIYVGRQAIAWGSARVVNPTDVIAPFTFDELDVEERLGVDAVRVRLPVGLLGELDFGFVAGRDFRADKSAWFARGKVYHLKTDISLIAMGFRKNAMIGLDLARSVGGAGAWFETAWVAAGALDGGGGDGEKSYLRTSAGLDYSFGGKIYAFAEYHYNGAGSKSPENYLNNFSTTGYRDGAVYLMGRHYLAPGVSYQISALVSLNATALINLGDRSVFIAPQIEYNFAENVYLSAGLFQSLGKRPESTYNYPGEEVVVFHSEFGGYPDIYFSSFRIYF